MNAILFAVLGYIVLQLLFAWRASRRVHNEADYLIAGRGLGPWMAVFTVFATWFGAETCIGAAGEAYSNGLSGVKIDPFGYALGIILTGLLIGAALWKRGILTLADLYRSRYGAGVERLAAIIMIPTSLLWAAAQIRAFGQVLAASSELGVAVAITLAAIVVIVYSAAGGMWADATTDLVQGSILVAGLLLIFGLFLQGDGFSQIAALPAEQLVLRGNDESWWAVAEAFAVPICGTLVAQELIARILAMRSPQLARRATVGAGFMYLAVGLIPVLMGLVAAPLVGELEEPEQVLLHVAQTQLGTVLYILFVGALVSAILSTVDSALLVAGGLAAHNLVIPLKPNLSVAARLRFNRIAVVCFGLVAYGLALAADGVYALVEEASSLGSAGLLVMLVFSLALPRIGGAASAYAAMIAGLVVYLSASHLFEAEYPYLLSLAAAFMAYLACAPLSRAQGGARVDATAAGASTTFST